MPQHRYMHWRQWKSGRSDQRRVRGQFRRTVPLELTFSVSCFLPFSSVSPNVLHMSASITDWCCESACVMVFCTKYVQSCLLAFLWRVALGTVVVYFLLTTNTVFSNLTDLFHLHALQNCLLLELHQRFHIFIPSFTSSSVVFDWKKASLFTIVGFYRNTKIKW